MIAIEWVVAIAIAQAAAQVNPGGAGAEGPSAREGEVAKADAEAIIARCGARKFESEVVSDNGGKLRKAKILLCAKPDDSDAQWIATLDKAAAQIAESPQLSAEAKAKVVGEIQAAIGLVRGGKSALTLTPAPPPLPEPIVATVRPLPPRPMPEPIVATVRPLPPMPAPKPLAARRAPVPKPPLSISCSEAGGPGGGDCGELTAATYLMVRATADVTSKVSLRFIRDGDPRGGIALGTMRRGQIIRTRLPARLCTGVVRGRVMLQTIVIDPLSRTEQIADSKGPLLLRC